MSEKLVVAIDGPAGAGKTTIARQVAGELGYTYIDTGAMYRAITLRALRQGITKNEASVSEMAGKSQISFQKKEKRNSQPRVFLDHEDVTELIRRQEVNENVSLVSSYPGVRTAMAREQKRLASRRRVVMEGRDIGTHVLPSARPKIFLTASLDERARRRYQELKEKDLLEGMTLEEVKSDLERRDKLDSTRDFAPLKKAEDAIEVDSTELTISQVVEVIVDICLRTAVV